LSMICGQTLRVCPEGKPAPTFPYHAPGDPPEAGSDGRYDDGRGDQL
jgi:hypothetical protein